MTPRLFEKEAASASEQQSLLGHNNTNVTSDETTDMTPPTNNDVATNTSDRRDSTSTFPYCNNPIMAFASSLAALFIVGIIGATFFGFNNSFAFNTSADAPKNNDNAWWHEGHVETTVVDLPGEISSISLRPPSSSPSTTIRWGIIGLGRIAHDFSTALKMIDATIAAVAAGSSPGSLERAQKFASIYAVAQSYGSYEELAADPNVDVVYIATINPMHYENAKMMLEAGKNVLLEKPMTMKYKEAKSLASIAKQANRLLLTNYWTRFFPVMKYVRSVVSTGSSGSMGRISSMRGDFGFPTPPTRADRYLNRTRGGGAMLDVGCYLINMAIMMISESKGTQWPKVQAMAQTNFLGEQYEVDTEISFSLNWDSPLSKGSDKSVNASTNMIMTGQASLRRPSSFEFEIDATHGRLVIHDPANAPTEATLYDYNLFGALRRKEVIQSTLPRFDASYGQQQYPRGEGFVYIIQSIHKCMLEQGIPGRQGSGSLGCLELEELTMHDQLETVRITDIVLTKAGYWDW